MRTAVICLLLFLSCAAAAQERYSLYVKGDDGASCIIWGIRDLKNKEVSLPANIAQALQCPTIVHIRDTLLVYDDTSGVIMYNIVTGEHLFLFPIPIHCDGVSGPAWSPSLLKALFVIINQDRDEGFEAPCRILAVSFNHYGKLTGTIYYDRMLNYECGSVCGSEPGKDFYFVSDELIKYRRHEQIEDRPGEWEEIKLTK
jgi:hypothetical protein